MNLGAIYGFLGYLFIIFLFHAFARIILGEKVNDVFDS